MFRSKNTQFAFYALAFGLALSVRLVRLGAWPLTEEEALWAMQSFDLVKGLHPEFGPQPLYILLTGLFFFVAQASEFAARLAPALAGAALVVAPCFFRDRLGEKPALVLAFLLAFEPGFLAMSRMAGSPILVVTTAVLAWGLWRMGNIRAAGILTGMALLSGPQLWPGLIGLAAAYGLLRGFVPSIAPVSFDRASVLRALAYAGGTYLVLGSLFLLVPGGLGAGLASFTAYFGGWLDFTDVPAKRLLIALLVYQLPALLVAALALARGIPERDELVIALGLWLLAALVLALANPYRQVADLAWALLPLWALAALEVLKFLVPAEDEARESLGMMAFALALLTFAAYNFVALALNPVAPAATQPVFSWDVPILAVRWGIVVSAVTLLVISIALVAHEWSVSVAAQGSVWAALVVLAVYSLSTALAAGGLRPRRTVELWSPGMYVQQAQTLTSQLQDILRWQLAPAMPPDVTVSGIDSAALRWALRDWNVTYSTGLDATRTPSIIITSAQSPSLELEAAYRGQDLLWRSDPSWNRVIPSDLLRWAISHELPQGQENIILWVRSDLFVDSQNIIP